MSKKSRRRNRKILATIAALGGAAMLANRRRNNMINAASADDVYPNAIKETEFKIQDVAPSGPVTTKTTIQDSMPRVGMKKGDIRPKNEKSIRVKDGKVYTIQDAKKGIKPKRAGIDTPGIYVREDGRITAGGKQYLNKEQYSSRNKKPAMLGDNFYKAPRVQSDMEQYVMDNPFAISAKKGGRIVKGKKTAIRTGAAKRGFGRAFKGGKR
tara:strand:+ start:75 stop:707 length:633 start_codon:yes stop_codon:yes gene_type:complete